MPAPHLGLNTNVIVVDRDARTRQVLAQILHVLIGDAHINVAPTFESAKRQLGMITAAAVVVARPLDLENRSEQLRELASIAPDTSFIDVTASADDPDAIRVELAAALAGIEGLEAPARTGPPAGARSAPASKGVRRSSARAFTPEAIVVAVSTGGPDALAQVLAPLPASTSVPILVVQHMTAQFTSLLADRLDQLCKLPVTEAVDGEFVVPGHVYIAAGGRHLAVRRRFARPTIALSDSAPVNFCKPSADVLFASAAEIYPGGVLALVMTGMGTDGSIGAISIVRTGGYLIAQDPSTATVASMPEGVVEYADEIVPLADIGARLADITRAS